MFQLNKHSPREDMGYPIDFRFRYERQGLCSPAQGDPREGYLRPEPVSLPAPAPRRGIIPETRSVSYLSAVRRLRSPFLKFRKNFIFLHRTAGMRSVADSVKRRSRKREAFLSYSVNTLYRHPRSGVSVKRISFRSEESISKTMISLSPDFSMGAGQKRVFWGPASL